MRKLIDKDVLMTDLLKLPGVGHNSTAMDVIRYAEPVKPSESVESIIHNLEDAIDEIHRAQLGNKSTDVNNVYLTNAVNRIIDAKAEVQTLDAETSLYKGQLTVGSMERLTESDSDMCEWLDAHLQDGYVTGHLIYDERGRPWIVGDMLESDAEYFTLAWWAPVIEESVQRV